MCYVYYDFFVIQLHALKIQQNLFNNAFFFYFSLMCLVFCVFRKMFVCLLACLSQGGTTTGFFSKHLYFHFQTLITHSSIMKPAMCDEPS